MTEHHEPDKVERFLMKGLYVIGLTFAIIFSIWALLIKLGVKWAYE